MIPSRREEFNRTSTNERYAGFLQAMDDAVGMHIEFRICETPIFISAAMEQKLFTAASEILDICMSPEYRSISDGAFPPGAIAPNETTHPEFVQVDFALVEKDGEWDFRLIELQGFPSLYGFQEMLGYTAIEYYGIDGVRHLAPNIPRSHYYDLLRKVVFTHHDPETVVLLEVDPLHQKTRPDFLVTERMIGVQTIDISTVEREERTLFYRNSDGNRVPIRRAYNRAIIDEIERKHVPMTFSFTDDLDVEWVCHPNWFYRISKFSIPYLKHPAVPTTHFLNDLDTIPDNLERFVLKPLYSFAGSGVIVSPTHEDIAAIPHVKRNEFVLQEKIEYAPALQTPSGGTKVELRVMFIWDEKPIPTNILVRTGRGKMMGVDYNKNLDWVGATCCLIED